MTKRFRVLSCALEPGFIIDHCFNYIYLTLFRLGCEEVANYTFIVGFFKRFVRNSKCLDSSQMQFTFVIPPLEDYLEDVSRTLHCEAQHLQCDLQNNAPDVVRRSRGRFIY